MDPGSVQMLTGTPGNTVKDYFSVGDLLGSGSCGLVYKSMRQATGEEHALKVIPKTKQAPNFLARFGKHVIEHGLLAFDHPGIVHYFSLMEDHENMYCVMEMLRGPELFSVMSDHAPLPLGIATPWISQMLSGLAYLHQKGFVHRDVKPENFMFETPELKKLKLMDFGLLVDADADEVTDVVGTVGYCAPEVFAGECSPASDVFSVGVIAAICVSAAWPSPMQPESWSTLDQQDASALATYRRAVLSMRPECVQQWVEQALPLQWHRMMARVLDPRAACRPKAAQAQADIMTCNHRVVSGIRRFAKGIPSHVHPKDSPGCMLWFSHVLLAHALEGSISLVSTLGACRSGCSARERR